MEYRWYTLDEAPTKVSGHLWCPACGENTSTMGQVWEWVDKDGQIHRNGSGNWHGFDWTHWHPFPEPPA